ncbi:CAF17-like 4Fe-4S cluster assembly/insertion protein YgfZ [Pseudohaliea rubra]|uniref:Folate-dependent protein for Fe/S cluster synthesis/repair in oxidative stress n=1 Tax=Pseudohaliea rubra DSM 19751 TaxID=1265313 RepID=A0A095VQE0_9GAMM|nr:folate-binding protein YgfZ [Pseudohaliea rubra]KGE03343.1 Folate-dependent protein for Fe/S cluster synthesis/repair in oxidative stress [Pseudohaliea rubra DSM 19751]
MTNSQFCELGEDSILALEGAGIAAFLQGQLTCDTRDAGPGRSVSGALCNARGRVVTDLRLLLPEGDRGLLRVSEALAAHTATVLGRYARFSRIAVEPARDRWQPCALWGTGAATLLTGAAGASPEEANSWLAGDGWLAVRCDGEDEAFELYLSGERGRALRTRLEAAGSGTEADWRALELRRGLLRLGEGQQETQLPQALNYDRAGLVSFRKGCYTGQEVVARLHYRGRAKKRWGLWQGRPEALPASGESLLDSGGHARGEVLRAVRDSHGISWIAALVRVEDLEQPLTSAAGEGLAPCPLPYPDEAG